MGDDMKRIVCVDDDNVMLHVLRKILEDSEMYEAAAYNSPKHALQELQVREVPHAIILDVIMPEMDGVELFKRIKMMPKLKDVPIIFLTGAFSEEKFAEYSELGAAGIIPKPIDVNTVIYDIYCMLEEEVKELVEA